MIEPECTHSPAIPVIYTAISGDCDNLKRQPLPAQNGCRLVAFLNNTEKAQIGRWEIRKCAAISEDHNRNAKVHKILSHKYFRDCEYSLWIDGSITLKQGFRIENLIRRFLVDSDIALFRHRRRNCIYAEAEACIKLNKDSPEIIQRQIKDYRIAGYPEEAGLAECTILLRRHTKAISLFNELWYAEIQKYSRRDQLSFNVVTSRLGLPVTYLPGTISKNRWFNLSPHNTAAGTLSEPLMNLQLNA